MRTPLPLPVLALAAALAGCSPPATERAAGWQVVRDGPVCMALHQGRAQWIAIDLTRIPAGDSGIRILSVPLSAVAAGPLPGYTLSAAGAPVRARNFGGHTRGDLRGIKFFFNPRPLLRRHPHGFRLAVQRDGAEVYAIDLADSGGAFRALLDCDRQDPFAAARGKAQ